LKYFINTIVCLLVSLNINSQFIENLLLKNENVQLVDSNKLYFTINNSNFLKDNEYFNNIVQGYTLMGNWVTPQFEYHPSPYSSVSAGTHLLKFDGRDNYFKFLPVFSFAQQFSPSVQIILGTLKSNGNHNMPEPLLDPERFYFNQADAGIQFLLNSKRFKSDIWLTWDNFIWYGDTTQERITFGTSTEYNILNNSAVSISLPLQTVITHRGGQINRPDKPIETLMNFGSGIYFELKGQGKYFKSIQFNPEFFYYDKKTSGPLKIYNASWTMYNNATNGWAAYPTINNGWAVYPNVLIFEGPFILKLSYWYSNKFYAPKGEAIYQCISTEQPVYVENIRSLAIGKLGYSKQLWKNILLTAGFEGYYDINEKIFDYNFSIQIHYNEKFLIHKF
jgi:hypothetical protein